MHCLQFNLSVQKEIETIWIEKCSFFWLFKGVSSAYWYFIYSFGVWSLISYELRHNESVYILAIYWVLKFYDNYGISGFIVPESVWCWPKSTVCAWMFQSMFIQRSHDLSYFFIEAKIPTSIFFLINLKVSPSYGVTGVQTAGWNLE